MNSGGAGARLVDGRFELLQRLGGGGMGVVWRALDHALDREVALKEVRPPDLAMAAADPEGARIMRERVLREARALARLQHSNVVTIYHIVDSAEHPHPWLVMELVRGGSLADRLERGPLGVQEAAWIGRGVLSALRAAHASGIQHRDVKPANILLRPEGTPVLTDFGIATLHDATALTATGSLIGSPEYMAPERIRGQEGGPSSDLWSLAMTLYVGLEGRHPLRRSSALATLAAVLDEPLPPPERSGPLAPLLTAMLAKDPAQRPDAADVDRALAAAERTHTDGYGSAPLPFSQTAPLPAFPTTGPTPSATGPVPSAAVPAAPPAGALPDTRPVRTGDRTRAVGIALSVVSLAVVTVSWYVLPGMFEKGARASGGATVSTTGATATGSPSATPSVTGSATGATATSGDLLTPAGVRAVIKALRPSMPGTKVSEFTVYSDNATAEAPTKTDQSLYNDLDYRDGSVTSSPGGTYSSDDTLVDLDAYNWDVLPALLRKAQQTLKVPHPTLRYIIVSPGILDDAPSIRVYLTDDYGGGYLEASPSGVVKRTYPRGS